MKNLLTILMLCCWFSVFAQTGIGTTTPNALAQLDVSSTDKGFLPPRVALTSTTSADPLASNVAGMVVYNTATTSDVTPGLYVNNGTSWVSLAQQKVIIGTANSQMQYWNGTKWEVIAATVKHGATLQMIYGVPTWTGGTTPAAPDAPTIGTASAGNTQATITFTAPANDGGSLITGYTVTSNIGGFTTNGSASPLTITGLTNGTAYTFTVTATNTIGTSSPSAASNSVTPSTVPNAPTSVTATAEGIVTFTAPVDNGGSAITGYTVTSNPGTLTATGGASPIKVTGLTVGTSYTFTVTATNANGNSSPSAPSNSITPIAPIAGTNSYPVYNPDTDKTWMDRNLGATQVATSSTDTDSYGDLYQWGRGTDGHQLRTNTATTTTLSSSDNPGHSDFIITWGASTDWRSVPNDSLWGVSGTNNPCPTGYRIPTKTELDAERASWSSNDVAGAFASPLKLPLAGRREEMLGGIEASGGGGYYWTSTTSGTNAVYLDFTDMSQARTTLNANRARGHAVRCIKHQN